MDDLSSASSYATSTWVSWFLASKGNEYFCEVDDDYILDRFNLTGLNAEVQHYPQALDLVTDAMEEDLDQETRDHIEAQGRLLYGLVHARYIITSRGLAKMLEKYKRSDFGRCPRVLCYSQSLLPLGLSDLPFQKAVKLYCPRCEDIYSPKSSRHGTIDGAFFGSSFPHLLFMVYPHMLPSKTPSSQSGFLLPPPAQPPQPPAPPAAAATPSSVASTSQQPATVAQAMQQQQSITADTNSPRSSVAPGAKDDATSTRSGGTDGAAMNVDSPAPASATTRPGGPQQQGSRRSSPSVGAGGGPHHAGATATSSGPPLHKVVERYKPRIFGFPVHEVAVLHRWQEKVAELREQQVLMQQQQAPARHHSGGQQGQGGQGQGQVRGAQ